MSRKTRDSTHHIVPISRRGKKTPENEMKIDPDTLHDAWHILWGNLLVEEVICLIEKLWSDKNGVIRDKYLVGEKITKRGKRIDKRMSAWETIFGDSRSARDVVRIIKETFIKRT